MFSKNIYPTITMPKRLLKISLLIQTCITITLAPKPIRVLSSSEPFEWEINDTQVAQAEIRYGYLNESKYFNTKFSRNLTWVQEQFHRASPQNIRELTVKCYDNYSLNCLYFDRGKDKMVVIVPGLAAPKEKFASFTEIFGDYDVLLFDLRGNSIPGRYELRPHKRLFSFDLSCKLGAIEEQDVFAIVSHVQGSLGKKYTELIGFGSCLGACILAKAQAVKEEQEEKLFDKIILDSCWPSVASVIKKYAHDPKLMLDNQHGGWGEWFPCRHGYFEQLFLQLTQWIFWIDLDTVDFLSYLDKIIQTPVLLFHSTDDKLVLNEEFESIWNALSSSQKTAVLFPATHARSHLKYKELYTSIAQNFIDEDNFDRFTKSLLNTSL